MKGPWFPTILADQCDGCRGIYRCVYYCPYKVLEIRGNKASVVNPLRCIYGCSACTSLCPKHAIIFPLKETAYGAINKKSLLHEVVCRGCGKKISTDRDTKYCFDCENKLKQKDS